MLMLTLDDAVAVCMRLLHETTYFDDMPREEYESMPEFIRGEFEQKCWIPSDSEPAKQLYDLICDINPAEICAQIEADNLKKWCEIIQVEMNFAMVRLPSAQPERKRGKWTDAQYPFSVCSECGAYFDTVNNQANYCPVCGADMRGEQNETD